MQQGGREGYVPPLTLKSRYWSSPTFTTTFWVGTRDVNDAEPRLLVFDAEPRLSFSEKKTSPGRAETLAKRARAEPRL